MAIAVYATYDDNTEVKLMRSEYSLTAPDMSSAGTKPLTVTTYKETPTTTFNITVKQQAIVGSQDQISENDVCDWRSFGYDRLGSIDGL